MNLSKYNIRLTSLNGFLFSDKSLSGINRIEELRLVKSGIDLKAAVRFPDNHIWGEGGMLPAHSVRALWKNILHIENAVFLS